MIKIEQFEKANLRIAEVKSIKEKKITLVCDNQSFTINLPLKAKTGDLIVVSSVNGKLSIPVLDGDIPLSPEKKIENGSKVQ